MSRSKVRVADSDNKLPSSSSSFIRSILILPSVWGTTVSSGLAVSEKQKWTRTDSKIKRKKGQREIGMCLHARMGVSSQSTFPSSFRVYIYRALTLWERTSGMWVEGRVEIERKRQGGWQKCTNTNWMCDWSSTSTCFLSVSHLQMTISSA